MQDARCKGALHGAQSWPCTVLWASLLLCILWSCRPSQPQQDTLAQQPKLLLFALSQEQSCGTGTVHGIALCWKVLLRVLHPCSGSDALLQLLVGVVGDKIVSQKQAQDLN